MGKKYLVMQGLAAKVPKRYFVIPDTPFAPVIVVDVNKDDADEALHPKGDEPSPEELDEAVEDEEADLPTFVRPRSPFPPSDSGLPDPIIVDVVIEPKPDDSLRLPLDRLSLLASQELFPPMLFPTKPDERETVLPVAAAAIPPLKLSLSIEGVGDVGPPRLPINVSPTVALEPKAACITDCNMVRF